jgi:glycosyltransferase involved in cell wall biosynthesis
MTGSADDGRSHLLLYEPRTEGHHLTWLRYLTEDLLSANIPLTLAIDDRPEAQARIKDHLGDLLSQVKRIDTHQHKHASETATVADCLKRSGAENVFMGAFDEIASDTWRRAAFGMMPPPELKGRVGGIYYRARFLLLPKWSPRRWLKQAGFNRIIRGGWLRQLVLHHEYLTRDLQREYPGAPIFFLPVPCPETRLIDTTTARQKLGLPLDRKVFLFYGGGYRRKGLHLAVEAMLKLPESFPAFLLCVGHHNPDGDAARGLAALVAQNRALLINRYVNSEEEALSFAASDVVLLPYIKHFGSSGVLGQAVAARKMVIVSDEQLLGRQTRDNGLGLLFQTGDAAALSERMREATRMPSSQYAVYAQAAERYAEICSRAAHRRALLAAIQKRP